MRDPTARSDTSRRRPTRGARRRELSSLLPLAVVLVAILSTFTLFSYRTSVLQLLEGRRIEAESLARRLSVRLAADGASASAVLRSLSDLPAAVAVVDGGGRPYAQIGPVSVLDDATPANAVRGAASYLRDGQTLTVRVELPAALLRNRERSLRLLTPLVLGVDLAVLALVMIFARRRLAPIDRVLERARDLGASGDSFERELDSMVSLVERALDVLASSSSDPLVALGSTLGQQLESGVVLCDAEGRVLAINARGTEILEVTTPRPSTPLEDAVAPHADLARLLRRAVESDEAVQRAEIRVETSAGRRELGLTVHPLRRDGLPRGYLVLFADLTEMQRRQAESRLAESLARLGELTAGVAHELRNSVASLAGHLTLLERAETADERALSLDDLRHETAHLRRVVDDFLSFARPGSVRLEAVDLVAVAHRVAADPSHDAGRVRIEAPERPVLVLADRQLLERVLQNLVTNALQASEAPVERGDDPEPVVLRVLDEEPAVVEVLDRGPGIPESIVDRAFEPFVSGRDGGTGLGLAIARRIVELHDGSIQLATRSNGGTRARVLWPRSR